jgi:glycosyltransferase involved in cell wall biosynthesis
MKDVFVFENPFESPPDSEEYIELWWGDARHWSWSDAPVKGRVGYTLSEHRSIYQKEKAMPNLQRCELLITPCLMAAQAFRELPLDIPLEIVPFGVDPDQLAYRKRNWNEILNFLLLGVAQFRKGTWLGVEVFRKQKDVSLSVVSYTDSPMFYKLKNEYQGADNISFYGKEAEIKNVYEKHHILVSPHLAEGWSLTIPEALATGMPAIVSRCSAPLDYFSQRYGWWSEMSENYAPVEACLPGVHGSWRLPDVGDLAEKMQYVSSHRQECFQKGLQGSEFVLRNLSWKQTAQKLMEVLKKHDFDDNASIE